MIVAVAAGCLRPATDDTTPTDPIDDTDPVTPTDTPVDSDTAFVDDDHDGWRAAEDCDDTDPDRHPMRSDPCNGVDDDCDGAIDEEPPAAYRDADGDGFGDPANAAFVCDPAPGWVRDDGDCDDGDDAVHPGAVEVCNQVDDDCDPATSEDGLITKYVVDAFGDAVPVNLVGLTPTFGTPTAAERQQTVGARAVNICPGTYYMALVVIDAGTVTGFGRPVLSGANGDTPLTVIHRRDATTTVSGVDLRDGVGTHTVSASDPTTLGGLLYAERGTIVVSDTTFERGRADRGGAIHVADQGRLQVLDSTIRDSTATQRGGAVSLASTTSAVLQRVVVDHNHAPEGAAVALEGSTSLSTIDTLFADHVDTASAIEAAGTSVVSMIGPVGGGSKGVIRTAGAAIRWSAGSVVDLQRVDFGVGADVNTVDLQPPGEPPRVGLGDDVDLRCRGATCDP